MPRKADSSFLGKGIYTISEASRLSKIPMRQIRRWTTGYAYAEGRQPPVYLSEFDPLDGELALSFADLMEVRFIGAFRRHGVSLQAIRVASDRARGIVHSNHPFSSRRFQTDGRTVFAEIAKEGDEPELLDLIKNQMAFRKVLAPYLKGLVFEADAVALWWPLDGSKRVIIDPRRSFGQPIVARGGVSTAVLVQAVKAEGSQQRAAEVFEVDLRSVRDAVRYEASLAA